MENIKVLLIDDEEILTRVVKNRLSMLGYKVDVAYDGELGINAAIDIGPDLIVLDLMLPKLDGFEVCRKIRELEELNDSKILVLSSKKAEADIIRCFNMGADEYMTKPFSLIELEARISKLLQKQGDINV